MSEIQEKYLYSEKGELYNKHFFYELKGDLSRLYRTAPMIPNYRILVVVNYSFFGKETFEAKEMELHFYEGILFYISFSDMYNSSSEMDKLKKNYNIIDPKLKSDYGFTSTIENKIVECKNNNNKIQTTEKIKYLTDKNIIGKTEINSEVCGGKITSYYTQIYDKLLFIKVDKLNDAAWLKALEDEQKN